MEVISTNPCLKLLDQETIVIKIYMQNKDEFIEFMKNTDEARKVKKKNGRMYVLVYEKVSNNINSIEELWKILK